MKLKYILFTLTIIMSNVVFSQNTIKMTNNYGSTNNDIQDLIDFENIYIEQLNFEGINLKNKFYQISIEEYIDGNLKNSSILFDGNEADIFKINSNEESLKFFFKLNENKLKIFIRGKKFGSKKSYFNLTNNSDTYALKDFFGNKKQLDLEIGKKNAVLAIITPTIHEDGTGSYCEVAQSTIQPEKLGKEFKIPQYFIISITFK